MPQPTTRRRFLQATAATGVGFWVAGGLKAAESTSPNEQIGMACVGIGGKGSSDSNDANKNGSMVAICDVDKMRLEAAAKNFPKAKLYTDFRKMLEEMGKSIDAVTVSTPDHCHAAASLMAMRMGKHCFCQKPLTRSIYEARLMAKVAQEKGVATQMGNQGSARDGLRRGAALLKAGVLGTVREVHVWTNRPIWPQGVSRPPAAPVPEHVAWEEWLGPASFRDYATDAYHPFKWRGWWDFGSGALGDMACHTVNLPFRGLDLRNPVSVQAETSGHNKDSYPEWSIITYEFPLTDARPALKMVWYDGGQLPSKDIMPKELVARMDEERKKQQERQKKSKKSEPRKPSGCLVVGEKGSLYSPDDYGADFELFGGAEEVPVEIRQCPNQDHFAEWVAAIKGSQPAMSNFPEYAGALTETILLGNLAVWVADQGKGEKVEWDPVNLKVKNVAGLEGIVKPTYREGYTLDV